jgi:hypothetical protein
MLVAKNESTVASKQGLNRCAFVLRFLAFFLNPVCRLSRLSFVRLRRFVHGTVSRHHISTK